VDPGLYLLIGLPGSIPTHQFDLHVMERIDVGETMAD
jgi:hypothetical protein